MPNPSRILPISAAFATALSLLLAACASHPPLTPVSASSLAARLANDACARAYGQRPFAPDDFEASLSEGRWHWGTGSADSENGAPQAGGKVDGFEAEISFDRDGGARAVSVRVPPE